MFGLSSFTFTCTPLNLPDITDTLSKQTAITDYIHSIFKVEIWIEKLLQIASEVIENRRWMLMNLIY